MIILKKYPVTYQCQKYEVRWEVDSLYSGIPNIEIDDSHIKLILYKVKERNGIDRILGKKKYTEVHHLYKDSVAMAAVLTGMIKHLDEFIVDENLFITEATVLIKDYERKQNKINSKETQRQNRENKLEQWDGIIK